jgi:LmbE family N-acetylglucosaminyl deacetylase
MPGSPDNVHPDALAAAPIDEVAGRVTTYIRKLRPQVVLTFDPIGGYRHPDHIAIQRATVRAFHAAGDPKAFPGEFPPYQPQKLYFHTFSRRLMALVVRLMPLFGQDPRHFGHNKDIDLVSLAGEHFPVHARIDFREVIEAKEHASACHASQMSMGPPRGLLGWVFRRGTGMETFMRAYPEAPSSLREVDLYSGINGLD